MALTELQQKILNLCAAGYMYKEIAPIVGLTERKVRSRVEEIKTILEVDNEWGAIVPGVKEKVGDKPHSTRRLKKGEIRILCLLSSDQSTEEIASKMTLAEQTVRQHISTILRVTGARTRSQAVHYFYRWKVR